MKLNAGGGRGEGFRKWVSDFRSDQSFLSEAFLTRGPC